MSERSHPRWCARRFCTAYATAVEEQLHRSEPIVIATDDPRIAIYVHRDAAPDGSQSFVDITELEGRVAEPWYLHEPCERWSAELMLPVGLAEKLQSAIAALVLSTRGDGPTAQL